MEYDLQVIKDGEQIIAFFENLDADSALPCPDLLLLDLNLPRRTCKEVLGRLRASQRCAQTPVVLMSSSDSAGPHEAIHFFRKPSDLAEYMQLGAIVKAIVVNHTVGI